MRFLIGGLMRFRVRNGRSNRVRIQARRMRVRSLVAALVAARLVSR